MSTNEPTANIDEAKKKSLPPWLMDKNKKGGKGDTKPGDKNDNLPPWLQKGNGKPGSKSTKAAKKKGK